MNIYEAGMPTGSPQFAEFTLQNPLSHTTETHILVSFPWSLFQVNSVYYLPNITGNTESLST